MKTTCLVYYNGQWYYVRNSKIDWSYTGAVKHVDNLYYYVKNGMIDWTYNGMAQAR